MILVVVVVKVSRKESWAGRERKMEPQVVGGGRNGVGYSVY